MIEPTDEMRGRAYHAARTFAIEHRHILPDDRMLDDVIAAVLALVERDYRIEVRPPWEKTPESGWNWKSDGKGGWYSGPGEPPTTP